MDTIGVVINIGPAKNHLFWKAENSKDLDCSNFNKHDLVGGFKPTPMKNMKVTRDDEIPNIYIYGKMKNVANFQQK